jgi:hypothetical protein
MLRFPFQSNKTVCFQSGLCVIVCFYSFIWEREMDYYIGVQSFSFVWIIILEYKASALYGLLYWSTKLQLCKEHIMISAVAVEYQRR